MRQIMVNVPDDIALRLVSREAEMPEILALGLREVNANPGEGFSGLADVLEFLAQLPPPQEVLALRLSAVAQAEVDRLLEKNRSVGLEASEQRLWQQYEYVEHLVRIAKAQALLKLQAVV
ncbi:MAG: hypothetical protein HC860_18540 [Alkalinema sp. RU_4_3]|nr:hypothetical protein [Alkalinema sp. RU_4_3]